MKNQLIKINRVFLDTKEFVRDQLIRLESKSLSSLFNRFGFKIISLSLRSSRKINNRIRLFHKFGTYLLSMNRRHGSTYVVKYLKACSLALSKAIAGQPFTSLRDIEPDLPLPRLTKSGLPRIIGSRDRKAILSGSTKVIRMYLSLFNLYRIISIPVKPKLSTITDPFNGDVMKTQAIGSGFSRNTKSVIGRFVPPLNIASHNYLFRETSSTTNKKSGQGLVLDAFLIANDSVIYSAFVDYCNATGSTIIQTLNKLGPAVSGSTIQHLPKKKRLEGLFPLQANFPLGQLSTKVEAAGKLRVFAIVDGGTQSLLRPLHDALFSILKRIPNDGTHGHSEAFERAVQKAIKSNCAYGYDLSAATDRLPISIQVDILGALIGREAASAGQKLLISRSYRLYPSDELKTLFESDSSSKEGRYLDYRYSVGQPMGALSSGAMLAITHHMVMQYCAKTINPTLHTGDTRYEIVGDDIIIFDASLAARYLRVMAELGVPINESKSVVSRGKPVVEFVKRTSYFDKEVSAIQGNMFASQNTGRGRISTAIGLFLKEKSFLDRPFAVFNTVLASAVWDTRPKKDSISLIALMNAYIAKQSNMGYLLKYVRSMEPMIVKGKMYFANFNFDLSRNTISALMKGLKLPRLPRKDGNYLLFEWATKEVLRTKLGSMYKQYDDMGVERQVAKHVKAMVGTLPKKDVSRISFVLRNMLFTQKINHLTLGNESILNDPKISLERLLEILDVKMNELSGGQYVDRLTDTSPKLQAVEVNTCEVLKLVAKGFNYQFKNPVGDASTPFDTQRFLQFVRKEMNYKDFSKLKGFEEIDTFRRSR